MKEWREYHSEEGEFWEFLYDVDHLESKGDRLSHNGNDAVMARRVKPSEIICVSILPKARQMDSVTGEIGYRNKFYLRIDSLVEEWTCTTSKSYTKEEIIILAQLFIGLEKKAAERVWKSKKLGDEGERIVTL